MIKNALEAALHFAHCCLIAREDKLFVPHDILHEEDLLNVYLLQLVVLFIREVVLELALGSTCLTLPPICLVVALLHIAEEAGVAGLTTTPAISYRIVRDKFRRVALGQSLGK